MLLIQIPLHIPQTIRFGTGVIAALSKALSDDGEHHVATLQFDGGGILRLPGLLDQTTPGTTAWILSIAADPKDEILLVGGAIMHRIVDSGGVASSIDLDPPAAEGPVPGIVPTPLGKRLALVHRTGITMLGRNLQVAWTVSKTADERVVTRRVNPFAW